MSDTQQIALIETGSAQLVSNRDFAAMVGVTEGAIRKAITRKELSDAVVVLPSGKTKLDEAKALELWRATHPDTPSTAPTPITADGEDYASWRLRRERAAALQAEKDLAERTGELIDRDTVIIVCSAIVRSANARLDMLVPRLLSVLPGDPSANKQVIEKIVRETQTELMDCDLNSVLRASRRRKKTRAAKESATE